MRSRRPSPTTRRSRRCSDGSHAFRSCSKACFRLSRQAWQGYRDTPRREDLRLFADAPDPEDVVFESHGLKVLVDPKSLPYLDGTELDFAKEGLNEGFRFNNPNVKDQCGCGESFNVK
jgi:Fe-S cluster assembly iron-binding protein IscA